jgi:hypothetical protein
MSYPLCETAGLPMKPDLKEATVTTGKKEYVIHPPDDLEFVPEAIIITRANGQRICSGDSAHNLHPNPS